MTPTADRATPDPVVGTSPPSDAPSVRGDGSDAPIPVASAIRSASAGQHRRDVTVAASAALFAIVALIAAAIAARALDVPFAEFLVDTASKDGAHIGLLSTAGIMVWTAAGAIALFAGLVVRGTRSGQFLIAMGAFTLALAADDAFLIHEGVVPRLTGNGRSEILVFALYFVAAVWIAVRHRRSLASQAPWWLLSSVALLGMSLLIDLFGHDGEVLHGIKRLEDAPKWIGIVMFSAWLVRTTAVEIRDRRAAE